jgi:hypothetical protein
MREVMSENARLAYVESEIRRVAANGSITTKGDRNPPVRFEALGHDVEA